MSITLTSRSTPAGSTGFGTTVASTATAHTSGNLLVACISVNTGAGSITGVTDTAGNTWHHAGSQTTDGVNILDLWYAYNITGNAANVVTVTFANTAIYRVITVLEFHSSTSGFASDPYVSRAGATGSSAAPSSGSVTAGSGDNVIVAMFECTADSIADGSPAYNTSPFNASGDPVNYFSAGYRLVTASESAVCTCANNTWIATGAAFHEITAGGLTGSDRWQLSAISNVARSAEARMGGYAPRVFVEFDVTSINPGVFVTRDISNFVIPESIYIEDLVDDAPMAANFTVKAMASSVVPQEMQRVRICLGTHANPIFSGYATKTEAVYYRQSIRFPRVKVSCADRTWRLDWRRYLPQPAAVPHLSPARWTDVSASSILKSIIDTYGGSVSDPNRFYYETWTIQSGMALTTFQTAPNETLSQVITRLLKQVGGYWYLDVLGCVHAYSSGGAYDSTPFILNDARASDPYVLLDDLSIARDATQRRTIVYALGLGAQATTFASQGDAIIYVDNVYPFSVGSGLFINGYVVYTDSVNVSSRALHIQTSDKIDTVAPGDLIRAVGIAVSVPDENDVASLVGGGTGIIETVLDDPALGIDGLNLAAAAELATFEDTEVQFSFSTRDRAIYAGKVCSATLSSPALSGTFIATRVTWRGFERLATTRGPVKTVEAGTSKRDLQDLLRRLTMGRTRG